MDNSNSEQDDIYSVLWDPPILIVDDEEGLRNILSSRLSKLGFKVEVAATGLHGLQKIKAGFNPHLIICDVKMPGLNGLDFCRDLRKLKPDHDIPIMLITAYPERDVLAKTKALGIKSILVKPFSFQDIFTRIVTVCKAIRA